MPFLLFAVFEEETFMDTVTQHLLALHYITPVTVKTAANLIDKGWLQQFHQLTTKQIAHALRTNDKRASHIQQQFLEVNRTDFEAYYAKQAIKPLPFYFPNYPKGLLSIYDAPAVLYAKGNVSLLARPAVAVIGSRQASDYTTRALQHILPRLCAEKIVTISGLAIGADTLAHKLTIENKGQTVAVLGSGFYHIYPRQNEQLAKHLSEQHLLLSEYAPYVKPARHHFPMRNRIVSGLAHALIVTEAMKKSGTLITTEFALDEGKDVFVVPGPIDSKLSEGTNHLITEGAIPLINSEQIIEALQRKIENELQ